MKENKIEGIKISFSDTEVDEILGNLRQVLESGYLVKDQFFDRFKDLILKYSGRKYCALASSDTIAQEILFKVLGLEGKVVVFQGNMFPTPVFSAWRAGCYPAYADLDLDVLSLTADTVFPVITVNTGKVGAVVAMHSGGLINWKIRDLAEYCKSKGVYLIEDCAHAYGSWWETGKPGEAIVAGAAGDYGVYSFYATKPATMGEGGAIVGDDEKVIERIELFTRYGKPEWFGAPFCEEMGYSARVTELLTAVGSVTLKTLKAKIAVRREIALRYLDEIKNQKIRHFAWGHPNFYKFPVLLDGITRDEAKRKFADRNIKISAGIYDFPVYQQKPIKNDKIHLPNTERFCRDHICLPMHEALSDDDVSRVIEVANGL